LPRFREGLREPGQGALNALKLPVDLNEPFNYVITIGNKGPLTVSVLAYSDALLNGIVRTFGPITVATGMGDTKDHLT